MTRQHGTGTANEVPAGRDEAEVVWSGSNCGVKYTCLLASSLSSHRQNSTQIQMWWVREHRWQSCNFSAEDAHDIHSVRRLFQGLLLRCSTGPGRWTGMQLHSLNIFLFSVCLQCSQTELSVPGCGRVRSDEGGWGWGQLEWEFSHFLETLSCWQNNDFGVFYCSVVDFLGRSETSSFFIVIWQPLIMPPFSNPPSWHANVAAASFPPAPSLSLF